MTGKKLIHGYVDRLRENVEVLDEEIANARKMSRPKGKGEKAAALQWAKTLRDLVELRNTTLGNIKVHLLGRDETGAPKEPDDIWSDNAEVEFERYFRNMLVPWTESDLKLECEDCGVDSEDVSTHQIQHQHESDEYPTLCEKCYKKRAAKEEQSGDSESGETVSDEDMMNGLDERPEQEHGSSGLENALTGLIRNTIRAVALDARSSLEKVKMLEDFKANLVRTAFSDGSGLNIEPAVALLDKEIERLQKDAETGKSQDADGKAAE